MSVHDVAFEARLDALLMADAHALDSKDMRGWLGNYADEDAASYFCRSAENTEHDLALAFMYDDCRARLEDRVTFVNDIWAGTFQDYRTRHFVQRVRYSWIDPATVEMQSNFAVFMTPEDSGVTQVQATGRYLDIVRVSDKAGELKLLSRHAELDTSVLPRYLVYPV